MDLFIFFFKWTAKKKNQGGSRGMTTGIVNVVQCGSQRRRGEVCGQVQRWNLPPRLLENKTKKNKKTKTKFSFKMAHSN